MTCSPRVSGRAADPQSVGRRGHAGLRSARWAPAERRDDIHRPAHHRPVLCDAVLAAAAVRPGEVWVDCTLGFGGHTRLLAAAGARVYGIDRDPEALATNRGALAEFGDQITMLRGDFRDAPALLAAAGVDRVDGLLADLGVSSWQLDRPERGFSFRADGPLDMRMDPDHGESALALIRRLDVPPLAGIIRRYGEEKFAGPIARAIRAWADGEGPHDTATLAAAVTAALPRKVAHQRGHHPATKTFQALRIAVNDELGALEALLDAIPGLLAPGGRALIITFHSLEDRLVKRRFADLSGKNRPAAPRRGLPPPPAPPPTFERLLRKPAIADAAETDDNPRARSAKLRAVRKLEEAA